MQKGGAQPRVPIILVHHAQRLMSHALVSEAQEFPFIMSWGCPVVSCMQHAPPLKQDPMICRLQARGLKVLVERGVRQKEFPQFEEFTPNSSGKQQHTGCICLLVSSLLHTLDS